MTGKRLAASAVVLGIVVVAMACSASGAGPGSTVRAVIASVAADGTSGPAPEATPTRGGAADGGTTPIATAGLPALPKGWPATLQIGMSDEPGGAAALAAGGFGFRYQYLAGGVNTGQGWTTWSPDGSFVTQYIQESVSSSVVPVFTYYQIRQSTPGSNDAEDKGVIGNLKNTGTMTAYWADLKLFFQKAGAFPKNTVVLHVEPDMWGYAQQTAKSDDAATVPAAVASTGVPELAGLPDNVSGVAQAIVKLRDMYAPNVLLAYHLTYWGTGNDPLYSKPSDTEIDSLASRSAAFYKSLHANFDLSFAEFSARDAGFYQYELNNAAAWWAPADYARNVRYISRFVAETGKRVVMWQIPFGNTKMRAENNTPGHYQDNRVEWLLRDAAGARVNLKAYADAGVIGLLFGGGAGGTTCACDAEKDGITNPAPVNGNTGMSLSADDDGGYFRARAADYYKTGALALTP